MKEYTIINENADVITSNGEKRKYTIISRENKYLAVIMVNNTIYDEFEVVKLNSITYIEKLEDGKTPRIQWGNDFIYPQDDEWWQTDYTLKVFAEYDWGHGYWKEHTLQEYLNLRSRYGTRSSIKEFAEFFIKLANVMEFFK